MSTPDKLHPYQAWLMLGHIDDPQNVVVCKNCHLSYEHFVLQGLPLTCREERDEREIARKKMEDIYGERNRY